MPAVLVVEQEPHYAERIRAALAAEGWRVRVVSGVDQALPAAVAEPPDLVMAGTDLPGFEVLVFSFSRAAGGPGLVGLAPAQGAGPDGADGRLAKPFNDQQVVLAARQVLLGGRRTVAAAANEQKLTSRDIFGDVLAEVESDRAQRPAAPARPVQPPAVARPAAPPAAGDEEIQRRLEKTLSGVFGAEPKPRPAGSPAAAAPRATAPAAPPRKPDSATGDVDALLSKTLSNLELGRTKSSARPAAAPAVPPPEPALQPPRPAAAPQSVAPAAVAPPPPARPAAPLAEGTAVRKARAAGDLDLSALEDLARSSRPAGSPRPAPPQASTAPAAGPAAVPAAPPRPAERPAPAPRSETPRAAQAPKVEPRPAAPPSVQQVPERPPAEVNAAATQRIPVFVEELTDQPGARFGQYTLLERIAVGGMAEVWKARMRGVEGFQKTVAIKRILTQMTDNSEFVGMFIDEAKLAAQLTHPNIVHIYDLGKIGRDYYIAMEYVEGKDLRSLLNAGRRKGAPLPLGLGLLIAARLASALDYAHRKRDFEDREMGLVHRDISPQNVLLTYEGDVKLCDFGIAKAVSKASQTQMGALKGKLQYMSPEQAWGRPVDARSDLFSLGAVLFEMVTGDRLFPGDSEMSVLELVRQGSTRSPRQVDPAIPREVDEIVARALAIDPRDRFQNAGEMKQRLEAALTTLAPTIGATDLAAYIRRVLEPESAEAAEAPVPALPAPSSRRAEPAPMSKVESFPTGLEATVEPVAPLVEVATEEEGGRKGRVLLYAAIAALIVVAVLTFFFLSRRKSPGVQSGGPPPSTAAPAAPAPAAEPTVPSPAALLEASPAPAEMPPDIKAIVDQELAAKAEQMRLQKEKELQDLEQQLAAARAKVQPAPAAQVPSTPAPEPTPAQIAPPRSTVPEPERTVPAPQPARVAPAPEPEPLRDPQPQVQAPVPEPEPLREPEPEPAPRVRVGDLVPPGPGVVLPQLVSAPKPEYPPMARKLRVEGTVVVSVLVDENGQVQDVRIVEPIVRKVGINEAAMAAARSARYRPATKEGVRVKMWTRLKIPFKL